MLILSFADRSFAVQSIPIHTSPVHTCLNVATGYVWQRFAGLFMSVKITPTAREFQRGHGKPVIRVNQSDIQILTLLTALVCQQSARMFVGNWLENLS
jgi:hypothetical protein